jgi:hypothetical protein
MPRLSAATRRSLPKSDFGLPGKGPGPGSYPMPDRRHATLAKSMAAKYATPAERKVIDAKANKKLGKR